MSDEGKWGLFPVEEGGRINMISELVQVAAVAFAAIECQLREAEAEGREGCGK